MRADELLRESDPALADIFSRLCKDVAARVNMDARDRRLAVLAALMGCGGTDAFRAELADALEEGIPAVAAREAVMQGAAYLGMGRPVNALLSENCFGDYYVREGLDARERELVTFCLLAAQGGCEPQLKSHAAGNFSVGNDAAYLGRTVLTILPWIGYPRSLNALGCIRAANN